MMDSLHCLYKVLTDLGSLIGGLLALGAGVLAYLAGLRQARATQEASDAQLVAAAAKDRLQRHGLALGVAPELDFIEVRLERAAKLIDEQWGQGMNARIGSVAVGGFVLDAEIPVPPILYQSFGDLYLLGGAGHTIQQLMSYLLQYDHMLNKLASDITTRRADGDDLASPARGFQGHLTAIGVLLHEAQHSLGPILEEAAPGNQGTVRAGGV